MTREDDYEPGEELMLMSDGALEVAEQTLENAVRRLEYVETLVPQGDAEVVDVDHPKGAAATVAHDAGEMLRRVRTERRKRENESLDGYSSDGL